MNDRKAVRENGQGIGVVVAHPDDEILWLGSVLGSAERIVFCFGDPFAKPDKAAARRTAVAHYPLPGVVDLAIPESGAGFLVDWPRPQTTPTGIAITSADAAARYEVNYARVVESLRPALAGLRDVYTHNPWGEYGHAEHLQVHRAVMALQPEHGYTVWFSNYVAERSWPLARLVGAEPLWTKRREQAPETALVHRLRLLYSQHGAWTWYRSHRWPRRERLYGLAPPGDTALRRRLRGETLLDVDQLRWRAPPWRRAERQLD